MAETQGKKRKMAGRRGEGDSKKTTPTTKWPAIKSKQNLQIIRLKEDDLFTVPSFLTSVESKGFITIAESMGFVHQGSLGPTKGEAYRDNDRISVNDPDLADTIWRSGLDKLFADIKIRGKVAIGLNPNIRFYRYNVGQRFGRHIDESVDLEGGKRTYYTLLIYLSGGSKSNTKKRYQRFQRSFFRASGWRGKPFSMVQGIALWLRWLLLKGWLFCTFMGTSVCYMKLANVTKGVKYVFRSDVTFC